jgi:hypothetical protein
MKLRYFARAAYRAFTTEKKGPTLYDLCDPLLAGTGEGQLEIICINPTSRFPAA